MCTSTLLVTAETRDAPEVEVLEGEVDLDDAGGLDARAQNVLLGGHVVSCAQPIQAVQEAARNKRPSRYSRSIPFRAVPSHPVPSRPVPSSHRFSFRVPFKSSSPEHILLELSAQLAGTFAPLLPQEALRHSSGRRARRGQSLLALLCSRHVLNSALGFSEQRAEGTHAAAKGSSSESDSDRESENEGEEGREGEERRALHAESDSVDVEP